MPTKDQHCAHHKLAETRTSSLNLAKHSQQDLDPFLTSCSRVTSTTCILLFLSRIQTASHLSKGYVDFLCRRLQMRTFRAGCLTPLIGRSRHFQFLQINLFQAMLLTYSVKINSWWLMKASSGSAPLQEWSTMTYIARKWLIYAQVMRSHSGDTDPITALMYGSKVLRRPPMSSKDQLTLRQTPNVAIGRHLQRRQMR